MIYIARIYRILGQYNKAHTFASAALRLDPNSPDANKEVGLAFFYLEEPGEARKFLQKYLELNPLAPDQAEIQNLMR